MPLVERDQNKKSTIHQLYEYNTCIMHIKITSSEKVMQLKYHLPCLFRRHRYCQLCWSYQDAHSWIPEIEITAVTCKQANSDVLKLLYCCVYKTRKKLNEYCTLNVWCHCMHYITVKSCSTTRHEGAWVERRYSSYSFSIAALDGYVSGRHHAPAAL
jgi:hypothetical protein